jgi:hypothetical protein
MSQKPSTRRADCSISSAVFRPPPAVIPDSPNPDQLAEATPTIGLLSGLPPMEPEKFAFP